MVHSTGALGCVRVGVGVVNCVCVGEWCEIGRSEGGYMRGNGQVWRAVLFVAVSLWNDEGEGLSWRLQVAFRYVAVPQN